MATMSKQVVLDAFGGPEGFRTVEVPLPEPGPGQVRVAVLAASVQYTDTMIRLGVYPDVRDAPPITLGYDVVGRVEAVGEGVDASLLGTRVADLTVIGSYASHRLLEASRIVPVPDDVDAAEAASLVLSWVTAYQLLHRHAHVQAAQTVLVQGAAGAVGQALLRLCQLEGLDTFGTARSEHAGIVSSFGATAIDYRGDELTQVLAEGVDVVFDGIAEDGYRRSWSVLKQGGFLSAFGMSAAINADLGWPTKLRWFARPFLWNLLPNGRGAGFYSITKVRQRHPDWFREDLTKLFDLLRRGSIAPRVAERIAFADIPDAHRRIDAGGLEGKLVLVPAG